METMRSTEPYHTLYRFMKEHLKVDEFPGDWCWDYELECDRCGKVPMEVRLVHSTGSAHWRFIGQVIGLCGKCGRATLLWGSTGAIRQGDLMVERVPETVERPVCACGGTAFYLSKMDRFEEDDWYDDGVVAGFCADCRSCRVMANFD